MSMVFDPAERDNDMPGRLPEGDVLGQALGSYTYVQDHRFAGLHIDFGQGLRSRQLTVSRYYFDTQPPTAIDFIAHLAHGREEIAAKRAYFEAHDIQYFVCQDKWDLSAIRGEEEFESEEELRRSVETEPASEATEPAEQEEAPKPEPKPRVPRTSPRRRRNPQPNRRTS